jgi:hypothetical protein
VGGGLHVNYGRLVADANAAIADIAELVDDLFTLGMAGAIDRLIGRLDVSRSVVIITLRSRRSDDGARGETADHAGGFTAGGNVCQRVVRATGTVSSQNEAPGARGSFA